LRSEFTFATAERCNSVALRAACLLVTPRSFRLALLLLPSVLFGQAQPRQPPCQAEEAKQFDFWLGDWTIERWNRTGPGDDDWKRGTADNRITKEYDGCVVREVYTTEGPGDGESLSVWDGRAKKWRQLWVDNEGSYLNFEGEWDAEAKTMILSVERETPRGKMLRRMVWHDIEADSLQWRYESSRDGGKTWFPTIRSVYRRKAR